MHSNEYQNSTKVPGKCKCIFVCCLHRLKRCRSSQQHKRCTDIVNKCDQVSIKEKFKQELTLIRAESRQAAEAFSYLENQNKQLSKTVEEKKANFSRANDLSLRKSKVLTSVQHKLENLNNSFAEFLKKPIICSTTNNVQSPIPEPSALEQETVNNNFATSQFVRKEKEEKLLLLTELKKKEEEVQQLRSEISNSMIECKKESKTEKGENPNVGNKHLIEDQENIVRLDFNATSESNNTPQPSDLAVAAIEDNKRCQDHLKVLHNKNIDLKSSKMKTMQTLKQLSSNFTHLIYKFDELDSRLQKAICFNSTKQHFTKRSKKEHLEKLKMKLNIILPNLESLQSKLKSQHDTDNNDFATSQFVNKEKMEKLLIRTELKKKDTEIQQLHSEVSAFKKECKKTCTPREEEKEKFANESFDHQETKTIKSDSDTTSASNPGNKNPFLAILYEQIKSQTMEDKS